MASLVSLKLGQISVQLGKGVTDKDISKIVGIAKGKYACTGCGFLGKIKLKDMGELRTSLKAIKAVERVSISG
ncbi:MAG TPA: hypothetical protein PKD83_11920 [Ignavibacteria bacterium]|nr:hypothetical protein [Ignavibacteria bacterium]